MATIWRIGAGDKDKDLVPSMLEHGVMMLGPGRIGDISGLSKGDIHRELVRHFIKGRRASMLVAFRDEVAIGELVVLRLGPVCFAVGAVSGPYVWREEFSEVRSYWNRGEKFRTETSWDLQHTRSVAWHALKDKKALCFFRRGIYGGGTDVLQNSRP